MVLYSPVDHLVVSWLVRNTLNLVTTKIPRYSLKIFLLRLKSEKSGKNIMEKIFLIMLLTSSMQGISFQCLLEKIADKTVSETGIVACIDEYFKQFGNDLSTPTPVHLYILLSQSMLDHRDLVTNHISTYIVRHPTIVVAVLKYLSQFFQERYALDNNL